MAGAVEGAGAAGSKECRSQAADVQMGGEWLRLRLRLRLRGHDSVKTQGQGACSGLLCGSPSCDCVSARHNSSGEWQQGSGGLSGPLWASSGTRALDGTSRKPRVCDCTALCIEWHARTGQNRTGWVLVGLQTPRGSTRQPGTRTVCIKYAEA